MQSQQADQSLYTNCKGVCDVVIFRSFAGIIHTSWMNRQPQIYKKYQKREHNSFKMSENQPET